MTPSWGLFFVCKRLTLTAPVPSCSTAHCIDGAWGTPSDRKHSLDSLCLERVETARAFKSPPPQTLQDPSPPHLSERLSEYSGRPDGAQPSPDRSGLFCSRLAGSARPGRSLSRSTGLTFPKTSGPESNRNIPGSLGLCFLKWRLGLTGMNFCRSVGFLLRDFRASRTGQSSKSIGLVSLKVGLDRGGSKPVQIDQTRFP